MRRRPEQARPPASAARQPSVARSIAMPLRGPKRKAGRRGVAAAVHVTAEGSHSTWSICSRAGGQHRQPVEAERDAGRRRHAVVQGGAGNPRPPASLPRRPRACGPRRRGRSGRAARRGRSVRRRRWRVRGRRRTARSAARRGDRRGRAGRAPPAAPANASGRSRGRGRCAGSTWVEQQVEEARPPRPCSSRRSQPGRARPPRAGRRRRPPRSRGPRSPGCRGRCSSARKASAIVSRSKGCARSVATPCMRHHGRADGFGQKPPSRPSGRRGRGRGAYHSSMVNSGAWRGLSFAVAPHPRQFEDRARPRRPAAASARVPARCAATASAPAPAPRCGTKRGAEGAQMHLHPRDGDEGGGLDLGVAAARRRRRGSRRPGARGGAGRAAARRGCSGCQAGVLGMVAACLRR